MSRLHVKNLPPDHVIVKLYFSNAFNCIGRDLILDTTAAHTPEIYRLVHSAYSCEPILSFGEHEIFSREAAQQGDPLGSLEFCEAIHPLLVRLHSSVKRGFMDDVTLSQLNNTLLPSFKSHTQRQALSPVHTERIASTRVDAIIFGLLTSLIGWMYANYLTRIDERRRGRCECLLSLTLV